MEENYRFLVEPQGKRVRLVVCEGGVEKVCRLETRKKLEKFLLSDENHLFKGRLQLAKTTHETGIVVKGKSIGVIGGENLTDILNNVSTATFKIKLKQIEL